MSLIPLRAATAASLLMLISVAAQAGALPVAAAAPAVIAQPGPERCLDLPLSSADIVPVSCSVTGPTSVLVGGSLPDQSTTGAVMIVTEQARTRLTFARSGPIHIGAAPSGYACLRGDSGESGEVDLSTGTLVAVPTATCAISAGPTLVLSSLVATPAASPTIGPPAPGARTTTATAPTPSMSYYVYGVYSTECGQTATTGCPLYVDGVNAPVPAGGGLVVIDFGAPCYVPGSNPTVYGTQLFNTFTCTPDGQLTGLLQAWVRGYESTHGAGTPRTILAAGTSNSLTGADPPTYSLTPGQMQASGQAWFSLVVTPLAAGTAGLAAAITAWAGNDMEQASDGNWYGPTETRPWVDGYGTATGITAAQKTCAASGPAFLADYGDDVVGAGVPGDIWASSDIYYVAWGATVACALPEIYYPGMTGDWVRLNQWAQANGKSTIIFTGVMSEDGQGASFTASQSWTDFQAGTGQSPPYLTVIEGIPPGAPAKVTATAYDTFAAVSWVPPPDGGSPITSYTITPYGGTTPPPSRTIRGSPPPTRVTIYGLVNGVAYTFTVQATNGLGTGPASTRSSPVTPAGPPPVAVLPQLSNGAYGGYVTAASLENTGTGPSTIDIWYFDSQGEAVGAGDAAQLAPNQGWTVRQDNSHSFPAGGAGSAIIFSAQPVAAFVNEFPPTGVGDGSSYSSINVSSGTGATLYAPAIASSAYGGYTTGIGLINTGSVPTDITISYRDTTGKLVQSQTLPGLPAHAYRGIYSGDSGQPTDAKLPANFAGTATVQSTSSPAQPLAAVVNEVGPGGQFSSYDAVAAGSTRLEAPTALNNAYGGFFTGMGIQNTTTNPGTVTVTYYDGTGSATPKVFPIAAGGSLGLYQGDPSQGPAPGAYTATITSDVPVAAIVNEVAPAGAGAARQSTSYNTFAGGAGAANLALVESNGPDGWNTGLGIMNTGTAGTTVTVTYFDLATGAGIGTPQSHVLAPNAYWGLFQPTGGLPNGDRATAQVTTTGGTVAVICNENGAASFMSYDAAVQ